MNTKRRAKNSDIDGNSLAKPEPLIPACIAKLLGPRPVIFGESDSDFDDLFARLIAEVEPKGFIEHQFVFDVAVATWEVRRYRFLVAQIIRFRLPGVARGMLPKLSRYFTVRDTASDPEWIEAVVIAASFGDPEAEADLDTLLQDLNLSREVLAAAAFQQEINKIAMIQQMQAQAEAKRDRMLKDITQRRIALGQRLKFVSDEIVNVVDPEDAD